MLINLSELLSDPGYSKTFECDVFTDSFETDFGKYDVIEKKPIELTITNVGKNKVSLSGKVEVSLNIPCDRCLEDVRSDISFFLEKSAEAGNTDQEAVKESEEQDYIDGYYLDVEALVFSEVLLNIPSKTLCREDCKGLCLKCGANLNISECGCDRQVLDPRMSAIQDIFNNYKEV